MERRHRNSPISRRRATAVRGAAVVGTVVLTVSLVTAASGGIATAGTPSAAASGATMTDPTAGHSYRHGAVPLRIPAAPSAAPTTGEVTGPAKSNRSAEIRGPVRYGGGSVITGAPHVYLVFWGSQWGSQHVNGSGDFVYTGDPAGLAPNLQGFFKGLGTNERDMERHPHPVLRGRRVRGQELPSAAGFRPCGLPDHPSAGRGVGGHLVTQPGRGHRFADRAGGRRRGARYFSNPPNAQYIVVSPTGTDPDGWLDPRTGFSAYHDDTGAPGVAPVSGPDVPYTNMPYVPDVGAECSSFSVPGPLDGADETISHEYAETMTDPFPGSGWTDRTGNEVADKCEFLDGGTPGGSTYVALATGVFALQGIWANDLGKKGGCETSHSPILTANPAKQKGFQTRPVNVQIFAVEVRGQALTYGMAGQPGGLTINPSTGLISGTPLARGRFVTTVVISDTSASTSVSFVWTIRR